MTSLQAYRIATLNINKIRSTSNLKHLRDFLYAADIDVAVLQEVTDIPLENITGYNAITNPGEEYALGTAILLKEGIIASDTEKLPDSRGIAVTIYNTRLINIYAPSGFVNKRQRADFFKEGMVPLFNRCPDQAIFAGDFNCVLSAKDQTPNFNKSVELERVIRDLNFTDTWELTHGDRPGFTYITNHSASRIDRIYTTSNLRTRVLQAELWPTIFSDHIAYVCTINLNKQGTFRARGPWKLNVAHLTDPGCQAVFNRTWEECELKFHKYDSALTWWLKCTKPAIIKALKSFSREKAAWRRDTIEFYFQCLRDLCKLDATVVQNYRQIKRLKAKILTLKREQLAGLKVRTRLQDAVTEETTSMYHVIQENKRQKRKILTEIMTSDGRILDKQSEIREELYRHFSALLGTKQIDEMARDAILTKTFGTLRQEEADSLSAEITEEEVAEAIQRSSKNKSPGPDGLPAELYQAFQGRMISKITLLCNEILNTRREIPKEFCEGTVVLVPKTSRGKTIENLRPITLLNSDYKIFARVMMQRFNSVIGSVTGAYQTSVGKNRTILQTLCNYRDLIATADACRIHCALVSLDFEKAFDKINHLYLLRTMKMMKFPEKVINTIGNLLRNGTSRISVNGQLSKPINVQSSVRQGCPISMVLFAIAIEPFLSTLTRELQGLHIHGQKITCYAYADDVTVLVTAANDYEKLFETVALYEAASGSKLNRHKSGIMDIGRGIHARARDSLKSVETMKCLGIEYTTNIRHTAAVNYRKLLAKVRAVIQQHNLRNLNAIQKVHLANTYITSKINYVAQVIPIPKTIAHQMQAALGFLVSRGQIFKVSYDTLSLPTRKGGLNLTDIYHKAQALYISKTYQLWKRSPNTLVAHLLDEIQPVNLDTPIDVHHISKELDHLKHFFVELSYIRRRTPEKHLYIVKEVYNSYMENKPGNVIEQKYSGHDWNKIWENIHDKRLPTTARTVWYMAVNRKLTTNVRLHKIQRADSPNCTVCNQLETDEHLFTCNEVEDIWAIFRQKLASILRTSPNAITTARLFTPDDVPYPNTKRRAVNWLTGHTIKYILTETQKTKEDYLIYLLTEHQRLEHIRKYKEQYANFLIKTLK